MKQINILKLIIYEYLYYQFIFCNNYNCEIYAIWNVMLSKNKIIVSFLTSQLEIFITKIQYQ